METLFLEDNNVKKAFGAADLQSTPKNGYISLASGASAALVLSMEASEGATVRLTLKQAQAGGTHAKNIKPFLPAMYKVDGDGKTYEVEVNPETAVLDLTEQLGGKSGVVVIHFNSNDLDVRNDYVEVGFELEQTATAKVVGGLWFLKDPRNQPAYANDLK